MRCDQQKPGFRIFCIIKLLKSFKLSCPLILLLLFPAFKNLISFLAVLIFFQMPFSFSPDILHASGIYKTCNHTACQQPINYLAHTPTNALFINLVSISWCVNYIDFKMHGATIKQKPINCSVLVIKLQGSAVLPCFKLRYQIFLKLHFSFILDTLAC